MYCSKCGAKMNAGDSFCSHCGQSFSLPTASSVSPLVPAAPAASAAPRLAYAGFWIRLLALAIDNLLLAIGFVLVFVPLIFLTGLRGYLSELHIEEEISDNGVMVLVGFAILAAIVSLLLTWLYHALLESSDWQATLGKKALGLVVTDMSGQRVSFGRSSGRHFGKMITTMIPAFLGYIMAGFTEKKQALHDMLSGCLVLRRNA